MGGGSTSAELVGRERELADLVALLDEASAGRGGLALLVGEPGIGKSRLAAEVAAVGSLRGFRVGWGRAWEGGGAPTYDPWTRALEAVGAPTPDAAAATAVDSDAARFQLFRRVVDGLARLSGQSPILLILDDLHAADSSSLRMLSFVARELHGTRVAIIATRRDLDPAITPDAEALLARVGREGRVHMLGRLNEAAVAHLVRAHGPQLPAGLVAPIWAATRGNPLFVREVVSLLAADPGKARTGEIPIPYTVRDIVRQRAAPLGARARQLLEVAALFGGEAEPALVAQVLGQDVAAVAAAAGELERSGLVVVQPSGRPGFPHGLIRDAVRADIPRDRRGRWHGAIAEALERAGDGTVVEVAHHALEAGLPDRLVERVSRAAQALSAVFADDDAAGLLARGAAVLEVARDARRVAELQVLLGRTLIRCGDLAGGRAACARAAAQARLDGDATLLGRAALAHATDDTQGQTEAATHALLGEALARLESPTSLRVRLQARWAASAQPAPDPAAPAQVALAAVGDARALGDEAVLLDVLHNAGGAFGEAAFAPDLVGMHLEAVQLAERAGDRGKLLRARVRLVFALLETGDVAGADAHIEALDSDARATGQPRYMWHAPLFRSMRAVQDGRFADAEGLADEAGELALQSRDPLARVCLLTHRFARLRAQGRAAELRAIEPEILAMVSRWNDAAAYTDLMIALIRATAGDVDVARRHLLRVPRDSTPARVRAAVAALATIAVRVGERGWAGELYGRLQPEAARWHVLMFGGFAVEATYARLLGGLAALLGRDAESDAYHEAALARAEEAGALPEQARVLAAHGAALAARSSADQRSRGQAMLARAAALAQELGLQDVVAATEQVADISSPASPSVPGAGRHGTDPVGDQVLTLTSEGETWLVRVGSSAVRLKDSRGLRYVARLVAEPGRELHSLDLAGAGTEADAGDAGELLDAPAAAAYRRRLAELDDEAREAEGWNDGARRARVRSEMEFLSAELARGLGLGGRARRGGSAAERARVAVTRRIREVIRRVAEQAPELGRHLEATLKTGTYCSYRPM
ncbi:MAG: ATP-binding protein [Polyangia bacterium]